MDIRLFDNYEEDGQLSMFGFGEPDIDGVEDAREDGDTAAGSQREGGLPKSPAAETFSVRIQRCQSCGRLLAVREEERGFTAFCNNCEIEYFQKR